MAKNPNYFYARGLGTFRILQLTPSVGSWQDVGYIKSCVLTITPEMLDIIDDTGAIRNVLRVSKKGEINTTLMQSSKEEVDLIVDADGKQYAVQYFGEVADGGVFQYFLAHRTKITPKLDLAFQSGSERIVPLQASVIDLTDELGYAVPLVMVFQGAALMYPEYAGLWIDPVSGKNLGTVKVLDISGYGRHGSLNVSTLWTTGTPANFLRFDGTDDSVDFGNVLNDDGTADFAIEGWVRVQGADASVQEILTKKSVITGNTAGYSIHRSAANKLVFTLGSGSANVAVTSAANVLQNVWKHFRVSVDRNGNATMYLNGVADGTPASVAALGTGTNALSLYLGRDGTNFGQADIGGVMISVYGAGALPSTDAAIALAHYNAQKTIFGL